MIRGKIFVAVVPSKVKITSVTELLLFSLSSLFGHFKLHNFIYGDSKSQSCFDPYLNNLCPQLKL